MTGYTYTTYVEEKGWKENNMQTEREYELLKELEKLESEQDEYKKVDRLLGEIEDHMLYQTKKSRELNDNLYESYKQDNHFIQLVLESEELNEKSYELEKNALIDCRDMLAKKQKETEEKIDNYYEEIRKEREKKDNE